MRQPDIIRQKCAVFRELADALAVAEDTNTIAQLLLHMATKYSRAEKASLMLLTNRKELIILAAKGLGPHLIRNVSVKLGEGVAGSVAKSGSSVLVKDIERNRAFRSLQRAHYKTRSFISCALTSKGKLIGVLNINDKKDGTPFRTDEFEMSKTLANYAAVVLDNTLLMAQIKSKAGELEDINKKLAESDIIKTEFFYRISQELRSPLNSIKGAVHLLQQTDDMQQDRQREFLSIIASEVDSLSSIVENRLSFFRLGEELRIVKKSVIVLDDVIRELRESAALKALIARKGVELLYETRDRTLEIVGDKSRVSQLLGNLLEGIIEQLESGDTIRLRTEENDHVAIGIAVSRAVPDSVVSVLQDTRYMFQIEHPENQLRLHVAKNIAESHGWELLAQNVDNAGRVVIKIPKGTKEAADAYVDRIMDSFVELTSELLDLNICSIMLSDDLNNELRVKSAIGLDADVVKKTKIKYGDKIAGWVALEGKPVFIEDIESDPVFSRKNMSQYTTKSLMSLPLKKGSRVIGVLNLNNKNTLEPFTNHDYCVAFLLCEKMANLIDLLYSEKCREKEIGQFISSLEGLFATEKTRQDQKSLWQEYADNILKNFKSLKKIQRNRAMPVNARRKERGGPPASRAKT